jgi:hypothetical protein
MNWKVLVLLGIAVAAFLYFRPGGEEKAVRRTIAAFAAAAKEGTIAKALDLLHPESDFARGLRDVKSHTSEKGPVGEMAGSLASGLLTGTALAFTAAFLPENPDVHSVRISGNQAEARYRGKTAFGELCGQIQLRRHQGAWRILALEPRPC